jgi:putative intracellular protease/amidase
MEEVRALVLFGDVVRSSRDRVETAAWLRDFVATLDGAYGDLRLAPFDFTQGDEVQGLLAPQADPLLAVLRAALGPGARPVRWVCVWGGVDPGEGPATQRTGQAFLAARETIAEARTSRERLVILTGNPGADTLLAGMTPALVDLLDGLTEHQRVVAGLALLDGMRQAEVAEHLGIRRATTSVAFSRAKVNSIGRLWDAIRRTCEAASAATADAAAPSEPAPASTPASPGDDL